MTAGANRAARMKANRINFDAPIEEPRLYAFSVDVRAKLGENLEGLEAYGDGISFRSPEPIEGGRIIELILCHAVVVEAQVVGCTLMPGETGSYWVRARFHQTPPALNKLICDELTRLGTSID